MLASLVYNPSLVVAIFIFVIVIVIVAVVLGLRIGTGRAGLGADQAAVYVTNMNNNTITIYNIDLNAEDDAQVAATPTVTYQGAELAAPQAISLDPSGRACVANLGGYGREPRAPNIALYSVDFSSGTLQNEGTIEGSATELEIPRGVAWRLAAGNIIVANSTEQEITGKTPGVLEYAATVGNNAPVGRVQGGETGMLMPWRVSSDNDGRIVVPDPFTDAVLIWASRPSTLVTRAPDWRIAGDNTTLHRPVATASDADGTIYVLNAGVEGHPASIVAYPSVANQPVGGLDVAPTWSVSPPATSGPFGSPPLLVQPSAIAVDTRGRLYVTDIAPDNVLGTGPGSGAQQSGTLIVFKLAGDQPPSVLQIINAAQAGVVGAGLFGPTGVAVI